MHAKLAAVLAIAAGGLSACATIPDEISAFGRSDSIIEIESVPFFPQKRYQCGPAALTTVLTHTGVDVTLDSITELTYLPARQGSLQTELLATARQYDRLSYRLDGNMAALAAELRAGRPVLVLQNLGVRWYPRWHYAVVVGVDAAADKVVLRSGTDRRRSTRLGTFIRTWQRSDYWAIVLLRPGDIPERPDRNKYFDAVAGLESAGRFSAAMGAWAAALEEWPGDRVALFGMATAAYRLGELRASERAYRSLLEQAPGMHAARNNLAYVLADQGRLEEAVNEIERVIESIDAEDPLRDQFVSSFEELSAKQFYDKARDAGIEGHSRINKRESLDAIQD